MNEDYMNQDLEKILWRRPKVMNLPNALCLALRMFGDEWDVVWVNDDGETVTSIEKKDEFKPVAVIDLNTTRGWQWFKSGMENGGRRDE